MPELREQCGVFATTIPQPPFLSNTYADDKAVHSRAPVHVAYYVQGRRESGLLRRQSLRTLLDHSLDRVVEGRIGLEKEAYGRLARGMRTIVALCAHPACWGRSQPQGPLVTRNCCLKCFLRLTIELKHRGIRDPGLLWRGSF
jgi:hypothetical protein